MRKIILSATVFLAFVMNVNLFAQATRPATPATGRATPQAQPQPGAATTAGQFDFEKWKTADSVDAVAAMVKSFQDSQKRNVGNAQFLARSRTELDAIARDTKSLPQSRYLAMLMLAGLSSEANPYPDSFDTLLAAYNDANLPEIVRYAAFIGIAQHARIGLPDQAKAAQAVKALSEVAVETKAPEGRSEDIHSFARFRAVEALGTLKTYDANAFRVLVSLIDDTEHYDKDNSDDNEIRYLAAALIGRMDFSQIKPDAALLGKLATGLAQLARHACNAELAYLENQSLQEQATGSGGGARGGSSFSGGSSSPYGDEMGISSSGTGTTSLNMSVREKSRVENSISRIRFAFNSINDAIGAKGRAANKLFGQIQNQDTQKLLKDMSDKLTAFDTFITNGPKTAGAVAAAEPGMAQPGANTAAAKAAAAKAAEAAKSELKVNESMLRVELQKYVLEFEYLLGSPSSQTAGT